MHTDAIETTGQIGKVHFPAVERGKESSKIGVMDGRLPLPTLLSRPLVAFTIEFDNEFEHRVPHRTTNQTSTASLRHVPWLTSRVMWARFMRFAEPEGIAAGELQLRMRVTSKEMANWLTRMSAWWGYLQVAPAGSTAKSKGSMAKGSMAGLTVRPTPGGLKALEVWQTLDAVVEQRWEQRFGRTVINGLRASLSDVAARLRIEPCLSLPIVGYGLGCGRPGTGTAPAAGALASSATDSLAGLLSTVLLAFALEFEGQSRVSLAICANVLRLAASGETPVSDLPRLAGISKEAIAMALSFLKARGLGAVELGTAEKNASRRRVLRLTASGQAACQEYRELVLAIEARWRAEVGEKPLAALRSALEGLETAPLGGQPRLFEGLEPYPDGWRAELPRPVELPHFPVILHRGGFPDGS
jgi:hypothetical protein